MSEESTLLGDVIQIYIEPFDGGKRGILVFELAKPISIEGKPKSKFAGAIIEEKQMLELFDGLLEISSARKAGRMIERVIRLT